MRLFGLVMLPFALAATSAAYAQAPYVDPALRDVLRPPVQQALRRSALLGPNVPPDQQPLATGIAIRKLSLIDVPRVALFAKIRGTDAISELQAAGARIGSRIGDIVTAEVPIDQLAALMASPRFEMLEAAHLVSITNDSGMHAIHADAVRRAAADGSWSGTAGSGVVVGVYDTGIDFLHEDFIDAGGESRILGLWDQTDQSGAPPAGFGYGRYCSHDVIQQIVLNPGSSVLCPELDLAGHGTHVAGTAAGDGSAIGVGGVPYTYAGVAPLADLMIVKGGNGLFSEASIIDGLVWLEQQARALNRPMVVNLSLGGQSGPHDGSRLYELAVDNLSRAGFIVVFAGGNDGINQNDRNPDGTEPARNPAYFHGSGLPGVSREFSIQISPYTPLIGTCNDFVNISLWYEAADHLEISVLRPDGGTVITPFQQVVQQSSPVGDVSIDNGSGGPNPRNNAYEADIRINDCLSGAAPVASTWTLRVSSAGAGSGRPYHFWMYTQLLGGGLFARGRQGFDNHYVVASPGNARSAVTVGAFVTKLCWTSPAKPEGPVCYVTREALGDIARFSSAGPTRDGRMKPEITAPGIGIASTRARNVSPAPNLVLSDGVHWVNQGTSMAAPHVTGAIALLLENRPSLTPADVKEIFASASTHDQFTSRTYDLSPDADARFWWGFGKLNVCAAVSTTGVSGGEAGPVLITPVTDTLPVNAVTRFFSCSPTGASIAFQTSDPAVATIDADGTVHALQPGAALIVASSGAFADTAQVVVTEPATLRIGLTDIAPAGATVGTRGARLSLLAMSLRAIGYESMRVTQLTYRVTGNDAAASLVLIADANRNRQIDVGERTLASRPIALTPTGSQVDITIDSLVVPQRDSVSLIAAIELSGGAPNGSTFAAELVPAGTRTTGTRSQATDRVEPVTSPLASSSAGTTILAAGESFSLNENPVRSGRLVFNFTEAPRSAGVYTLTGRLVADLKQRAVSTGSVEWNLTNDDGARVAPGAYLVVFRFAQRTVREKIFVLRGADR